MRHSIVCPCESVFEAEVPDTFDIDAISIESILAGDIMRIVCPECGESIKAEFAARFSSNALGLELYLVPEIDRVKLEAGKLVVPQEARPVVGFAELSEALKISRDGLDHRAIEAMKILLYDKALSAGPEGELRILYEARKGESLEFRIHGLKKDEIAVIKVSNADYEETVQLMNRQRCEEPWKSILEDVYVDARRYLEMIEAEEGEAT